MTINYSPAAIEDFQGILDYYSKVTENNNTGKGIVIGIQETISKLKDFPKLGRSINGFNDLFCNYRFLSYEKYIVIYKPVDETIYIERVIHSSRDYIAIIKKYID